MALGLGLGLGLGLRSSAPQSRARSVVRDQHSAPEKKSCVVRDTGAGGWPDTRETCGICGISAEDAPSAAPTFAPSAAAAASCAGQCGLCRPARLAGGTTRSRLASKQRALGAPLGLGLGLGSGSGLGLGLGLG